MEVIASSTVKALINPSQISQVLLNLISNAADAVEGLDEKWIRIELSSEATELAKIRVVDSGSGIDPKLAHKIMEPFFTTKPTDKGTGLGLSIAKGIVDDHRGTLYIEAGSKNTSFAILLPKTA